MKAETNNTNSETTSILSYIGAGLLGLYLNQMVMLIMQSQTIYAIWVSILYFGFVFLIGYLCDRNDVKECCKLNDFWITLETIVEKKMDATKWQ